MKITIAGCDYTAALDAARPLTIERKLNAPSLCSFRLTLPADGSLAAPARWQPVAITGEDGAACFTGYIAANPMPEYAGLAMTGPRYRLIIEAISDELLLDQLMMPPGTMVSGLTAGALLDSLVTRSGSSALSTQGAVLDVPVSSFAPRAGEDWSRQAGQAAGMARARYRVLNGALTLAPIPAAVHTLNESDGTLNLGGLSFSSSMQRALANDITVCGENEAAAYVTEYFLGDGVTTQFNLSADPWLTPSSASNIIRETFSEAAIDARLWSTAGTGGALSIGPNGLAVNGGSGRDGQTLLAWLDSIEMGGTLLMEAVGVRLQPGSEGILAGFFTVPETADCCVAGFQVTAQPQTGAVTLQPLLQGAVAGSTYAINPANQYTLRLRVHSPEVERMRATYYSCDDSGPISAGGEGIVAPGQIQMEIQEFINGLGAPPVTLYDGGIASLPGSCVAVAASSISLTASMRALNLRRLGSGWVVSTPASGSAYTRRIGSVDEAGECLLESTGKLVFAAGSIPAAGEQIAVSYRALSRAVGRAVNTASQQALQAAGSPPEAAWIGTVSSPAPRSSADCRNAAQMMAQAAASASAMWSGTFATTRFSLAADVWPGDALQLNAPSAGLNAQVVVRSVKLQYAPSLPDLVRYEIVFANDWAADLAIKTSAAVPANTWLPAPVAPSYAANLNALRVTALSGSSVTIDAGATPPAGGGFEIRLRDNAFMPGEDPTLVARTAVSSITFARVSWCDRFYIRMYDGATPPNYSEFSAAVFVNLPVG
jgi:hypothetical protein